MHVKPFAAYKVLGRIRSSSFLRPRPSLSRPPTTHLRTGYTMPRIVSRSLLALAIASVALCTPEPQLDGLSFTSDGTSGLPGGADRLIPAVQSLADTEGGMPAIPDLNLSADGPTTDSFTDNLPSSAALQDGLAARPNDLISDLEDPYPEEDAPTGRRLHAKRQTFPGAPNPQRAPPSSQGPTSNRQPARQGSAPPTRPNSNANPTAPQDRNHMPLQELQLTEFVSCLSSAGSGVQQRAVDVLKRANEGAAAFHELPCSDALPSQASDVLFGSFSKRTTVGPDDLESGLTEIQSLVATLSAMGTKAQGLASGNTKRASFGEGLRDYRVDGESQYSSHRGHHGHGKHHGHGEDGFMREYMYDRRQFQDTKLPAALDEETLSDEIRSASQTATPSPNGTARPVAQPKSNNKLLGVLKREESSFHARPVGNLERRQSATSSLPAAASGTPSASPNSTNPDPNSIEAIVKGVGSPVTSGLSSGNLGGAPAEKRDAELEPRQVGGLPHDFDPFNGEAPIDGDELAAAAGSGSSTTTPTNGDDLTEGLATVEGVLDTVSGYMSNFGRRALSTLKALQQIAGPVASSAANAGHKREDLVRRQRTPVPAGATPNRRPAPPNRASPSSAAPSASSSAGIQSSLTNLISSVSQAGAGGKRSVHDDGRHAVIDPVLHRVHSRDGSANANAAEREAVDAVHNVNSGARLAEGSAADGSQDLRLHLDSLADVATTFLHPTPTPTSTAGVSIQTLDGSANKQSPRALIDTGKISNQLASVKPPSLIPKPGPQARALIDTGKISNQLSGLTGKLKRDVGLEFAENERRSPLPPSRMDSHAEEANMSGV
ncbi:hypothetical protein PENSPDRAFT_731230 [Peniophora sp. CONT]|nr:hypothetical protein PENSPDRAFT_731230 [Peniophora sp. CONT]